MTSTPARTRRRLLGGLAVAAVGTLAGCSDTSVDSESTGETEPAGGEPSEFDLREANVVGVEATVQETAYEFAVEQYHDDDGEDGYADWWQVEQLDGTQLGRRELLHAHSTEPFERSETIEIPADVGCVVVRGHDQTHGYGGQAMLFTLESGATRTVDQGREPDVFADAECP